MNTINLPQLSRSVAAYHSCVKSNNIEWKDNHEEKIEELCKNLPHGSGINAECRIELPESKADKLVFYFQFHHLNENGYYTGWTEHNVIVTPKFGGFDIRITGKNKNNIKEYLQDVWHSTFTVIDKLPQ